MMQKWTEKLDQKQVKNELKESKKWPFALYAVKTAKNGAKTVLSLRKVG